MQIKITRRYHFGPTGMALVQRHPVTSAGKDADTLEPSHVTAGNAGILESLTREPPYDPEIQLPDI